jgi:prevent-host-death family protein
MKKISENRESLSVEPLLAASVSSYAENMTRIVSISEAKANLSKLADDVVTGEEVIVMRSGKAVMKLVSLTPDEVASAQEKTAPRDLWVTAKYFKDFDWEAWDKLDEEVHNIWRKFGHMD